MSIGGESPSGELSDFETQFVPQPDDDEVLWEVIEIVDERDKKYQVRWAGNDPNTGNPWPLDWIPKHDCTYRLVEEWKRKKAEKRRRSKKTGGRTTAKSRSLTSSKVSTTSSFRKTRSVAEDNVLTGDDEPPRAQPSTSKLQSSKRKRTYITKESSDSEPGETPEPEYPKKKRKFGHREELVKQKRKNAPRTLASRARSIELDAVDAAASGDVDGETIITKSGLPARQRLILKPKEDTVDKSRITAIITPTKYERSSGQRRYAAFSKKKKRYFMATSSEEEADTIHEPKRPPVSRFTDRMTHSEIATDETAVKHFKAHSPVASRVSSPALPYLNSSPVPAPPLRHQPRLSPGARARLEIFDSQMGIKTNGGGIDDPYVNIGDNANYGAAGDFEPCDLSLNPPPKFPTPPPTTTSTTGRKKQPHDSSGIVPETESSQSQPSRPKPKVNGKNVDTPLLKPPSRPTSPSGRLRSVPPTAIMRASSSSRSPSHTGHAASSNDAPARPQKSATGPIPYIDLRTSHKVVKPFTSELDNEPPMSSIESFPSPRKDKGKQRFVTDADELQGSSDEEYVLGRMDADLRARGEALYEQELKKKELLRVTNKPPPKKTLNDVARSRVPLIMTVNGKQSTNGTHPFASSKKGRQGDLVIVQQMEEAYVDLNGGNSTTIDTFTQSEPQDKGAQRIILREEVEENTQEALLGGNPALPAPQVNVAEKPEIQPPEFVIDDVEMCGGNDDVQPSPPMPAERSENNQPSTHTDDLHVASMIVNPSQGQLQERDNEEIIIIDLASSPPRSPRNNADATMGRLNHALSALNKKSDEIQALQRELTLEREKSSKLEDELKVRQAANPTTQEARASSADPAGAMQSHPAVSELADVRAKWNQEREVWEADRRKWEEEIARLTTERDRLETDAHGLDEVRTSRDADRAAFQLERERWEEERNKLGLQVTDGHGERKTWSEEGARLPDQITSLTEACGAFEAERAQWKQEQTAMMAERAAWASERESWVLQQAASTREDASHDVNRELERAKWASSKEMWEAEREKWSAEHAMMTEARDALIEDAARLSSSLDAMTRSKALAEKDRDFFRDQYLQASGFVSTTRADNAELEQKAAIAEGQARDGVALIKSMFGNQIKALKDDIDRWKGVAALLQEKDRRTNDLIRRRAAEQPELAERCRQLEDQVDSLHAELEFAHQESSFQFSKLQKQQQNLELRSVKLTYPDVKPGEIIEVTNLPDPDASTWTLDSLAADLSSEEAEDDEYGLYPCRWKTGASAIDQCQQAFDCREDLDRHMHDYHYRHQLEAIVYHD